MCATINKNNKLLLFGPQTYLLVIFGHFKDTHYTTFFNGH